MDIPTPDNSILIEAENFQEKRGWKVDQQFMDIMGSPYLLAHNKMPDFLANALFYKTNRYYIPYRCLYSNNISNLLMAGRCFSSSHVGLGGPRVINTTGQMGLAVGYAASLCKKYDCTPRAIYEKHLSELTSLVGYPPQK